MNPLQGENFSTKLDLLLNQFESELKELVDAASFYAWDDDEVCGQRADADGKRCLELFFRLKRAVKDAVSRESALGPATYANQYLPMNEVNRLLATLKNMNVNAVQAFVAEFGKPTDIRGDRGEEAWKWINQKKEEAGGI